VVFEKCLELTHQEKNAYGACMLPEIEKLLVLQDRDRRIRTLKTELKNAPLERLEMESRLAVANSGAEQLKQKLRELEVRRNKLAGDAQGKRDQIARFKTQQMQTRKNEEFQALANEIAHFEKEIQKIEDEELEVMDALEHSKPAVAEAEKKAAEARRQVAQQLTDLDAKAKALAETLVKLEAERPTFTQGIDEDLLDLYNRLFKNKEGDAVVALEHEVCRACHMKPTTKTAVRVKGGREVAQCEQCGRILYLGE
jgi:predicted  nucleic acid-binding Zn-ribbon protein